MIAVDPSALVAVVFDEPEADACIAVLEAEGEIVISAGTVAEALIVAARRNVGEEMTTLIDGMGISVATVTHASARRIAPVRISSSPPSPAPAGTAFGAAERRSHRTPHC